MKKSKVIYELVKITKNEVEIKDMKSFEFYFNFNKNNTTEGLATLVLNGEKFNCLDVSSPEHNITRFTTTDKDVYELIYTEKL
jgi:hypothetical protein